MGRVKSKKFGVCTYLENTRTTGYKGPPMKRVFDDIHYEHPDVNPEARDALLDRKQLLEGAGKKAVKAYILTEIEREDDR